MSRAIFLSVYVLAVLAICASAIPATQHFGEAGAVSGMPHSHTGVAVNPSQAIPKVRNISAHVVICSHEVYGIW